MDGSKSIIQLLAVTVMAILALSLPVWSFKKVVEKAKIDGVDTHDLDVFIEKKVRYLHSKIDMKPAVVGLLSLEKCASQLAKGAADSLELTLSKNLR